jgi:hypothetical protein
MERCNLAVRKSDGRMVTLDWIKDENRVVVIVNEPNGEDFILNPPNAKALDAFYHPYVYVPVASC